MKMQPTPRKIRNRLETWLILENMGIVVPLTSDAVYDIIGHSEDVMRWHLVKKALPTRGRM